MDTVKIILRNKRSQILVQMRDNSPGISQPLTWGLWGGGIESTDSDYRHAAARELYEELAFQCTLSDFELVWEYPTQAGAQGFLVACRKTVEWGGFVVNEGAGAAFFEYKDLQQMNVSNHLKLFLTHKAEYFQ